MFRDNMRDNDQTYLGSFVDALRFNFSHLIVSESENIEAKTLRRQSSSQS